MTRSAVVPTSAEGMVRSRSGQGPGFGGTRMLPDLPRSFSSRVEVGREHCCRYNNSDGQRSMVSAFCIATESAVDQGQR